MGSTDAPVTLALPVAGLALDSSRIYYLSDQVTGQVLTVTPAQMGAFPLTVPAYATRVYVLDSVAVTSTRDDGVSVAPGSFALLQNYPNPFNPSTTIAFELPEKASVRLSVFDILGREVATLINGTLEAGRHAVVFTADRLATGVYFYRFEGGGTSMVKKMVVLK